MRKRVVSETQLRYNAEEMNAERNLRQCLKCKGWFSEGFFRKVGRPEKKSDNQPLLFDLGVSLARDTEERRPTCIGCQLSDSDAAKKTDRFLAKARSTIWAHSQKLGISKETLCNVYGWTVERIAHLFRHGYENTCTYCWVPYATMGHGLADITLDIRDPSDEPWIRSNVIMCCATCNRSKSDMSPEQWELRLLDWKTWREVQKSIPLPDLQPNLGL